MKTKEPSDELEPLFDYSRVQPVDIFSSDDEKTEPFPFPGSKRKRSSDLDDDVKEIDSPNAKIVAENKNDKENKEEDWMPPPPLLICNSGLAGKEDKILQELRLRKQELAFTLTADDILKAAMESIQRKQCSSAKPASVVVIDQQSKPERQKIFISIQDKDGEKKFCMYMDDKLERLFKMYADKSQVKLDTLVFCFDGDKLNPAATPASLGLENHDIIEVHSKAH